MAGYSGRRIALALAVTTMSACTPMASTTPVLPLIPTPPPATQTCPDASVIPATANCPMPAPAPLLAPAPVEPFNIFFDWGKAEITSDAAAILDNAAAAYAQTATASITLAAYSDRSGPARSNAALAQRRADAAKAYLVSRGVAEGAITTHVSGENKLLIETADGVREAQNRRVEIAIVPGPGQ